MSTSVVEIVATAPPGAVEDDLGLLSDQEVKDALRLALGDAVGDDRLDAAVAAIRAAEAAKWEQLPPEINEDLGLNFPFAVCTETCWLGRQILIEGALFRMFRLREAEA